MYRLLAATAAESGAAVPAGFIHLPLLPEQVAASIAADAADAERGAGPLPSMALETQLRAVQIALRTTLAEGLRKRRRRHI
jgi:pyrrolidone-carboxylate peptidase